jgi:hypothetical protein
LARRDPFALSGHQVDANALLRAWKERFLKRPWDPHHKVLASFPPNQHSCMRVEASTYHCQTGRSPLRRLSIQAMTVLPSHIMYRRPPQVSLHGGMRRKKY